jgi:hypothetical protein
MKNEYKFNYDEIKRIFESVPETISYKTYFQPRAKSATVQQNDRH